MSSLPTSFDDFKSKVGRDLSSPLNTCHSPNADSGRVSADSNLTKSPNVLASDESGCSPPDAADLEVAMINQSVERQFLLSSPTLTDILQKLPNIAENRPEDKNPDPCVTKPTFAATDHAGDNPVLNASIVPRLSDVPVVTRQCLAVGSSWPASQASYAKIGSDAIGAACTPLAHGAIGDKRLARDERKDVRESDYGGCFNFEGKLFDGSPFRSGSSETFGGALGAMQAMSELMKYQSEREEEANESTTTSSCMTDDCLRATEALAVDVVESLFSHCGQTDSSSVTDDTASNKEVPGKTDNVTELPQSAAPSVSESFSECTDSGDGKQDCKSEGEKCKDGKNSCSNGSKGCDREVDDREEGKNDCDKEEVNCKAVKDSDKKIRDCENGGSDSNGGEGEGDCSKGCGDFNKVEKDCNNCEGSSDKKDWQKEKDDCVGERNCDESNGDLDKEGKRRDAGQSCDGREVVKGQGLNQEQYFDGKQLKCEWNENSGGGENCEGALKKGENEEGKNEKKEEGDRIKGEQVYKKQDDRDKEGPGSNGERNTACGNAKSDQTVATNPWVVDSWEELDNDENDYKISREIELAKSKIASEERPVRIVSRPPTCTWNDSVLPHVLEAYCRCSWPTEDFIRNELAKLEAGDVAIHPVDEHRSLVVFASRNDAARTLITAGAQNQSSLPEAMQLRALCDASEISQDKARKDEHLLGPYVSRRPTTTALVARRLIEESLGKRSNVSKQQIDEEKQQLKNAKGSLLDFYFFCHSLFAPNLKDKRCVLHDCRRFSRTHVEVTMLNIGAQFPLHSFMDANHNDGIENDASVMGN
ncbi:unnamed protein product [Gongylonema pulchrum]|uniref:Uncharacterized protein n=1 Tax=Gongylonema pulchrum TaxID=637853 RepID=A0A3P7MJJ9_9BILA|nr:unnamed protein product [Gongylonema pulchrum]